MKTNVPEKVLRVGVIHGGKVLEEKLIMEKAAVSVGRARAATIALPIPELSRENRGLRREARQVAPCVRHRDALPGAIEGRRGRIRPRRRGPPPSA